MSGPAQSFDGELVLETEASLDLLQAAPTGPPRVLRTDGNPNTLVVGGLIRPSGSFALDGITPAVWLTDGTGVWVQPFGQAPPIPGDPTPGVPEMLIYEVGSGATLDLVMTKDLDILDVWVIKTGAGGGIDDQIRIFFLRPVVPELAWVTDMEDAVGSVYHTGNNLNGAAAWSTSNLRLAIGDTLRLASVVTTTNAACRVFFLVAPVIAP